MASGQGLLARESSAGLVYTTWACIVEDDRPARQTGRAIQAAARLDSGAKPGRFGFEWHQAQAVWLTIPQTVAIRG
jgi:hypothetical protein